MLAYLNFGTKIGDADNKHLKIKIKQYSVPFDSKVLLSFRCFHNMNYGIFLYAI